MMLQLIDIGAAPDDHTGDDLRTGGGKINNNFTELYGLMEATVIASEDIAAGDYVNVYDNAGTPGVRLADATNPAKFATGYAPAAIDNGDPGVVRSLAAGNASTAPAQSGEAWLSVTVPGGYQFTRPVNSGEIVQSLGIAVEAVGVFAVPPYLEL
jgi:hypothetical protein